MNACPVSLALISLGTMCERLGSRVGLESKTGSCFQRAAGSFAAFLTIDKHIEQREPIPGALAVITIRARSNRIQSLRPLVPEILEALQDLKPGRSVRVGV